MHYKVNIIKSLIIGTEFIINIFKPFNTFDRNIKNQNFGSTVI